MESQKNLEIADIPIFTTEASKLEQESLLGGENYYINKDKYNCYSYYNQNWGGTYYKCYQDDYIQKVPSKEKSGGTFLP